MKIKSGLVFIGFCLFLSSCTNSKAVEGTAPAGGSAAEQQTVVQLPKEFKKTLTGKLDGRFAVQMDLERIGDKLNGTYFYDRPGAMSVAAKYIALEGSIDQAGNVTLIETAYDSEKQTSVQSGEFKGKLSAVAVGGATAWQFTGAWTRARDKKTMPFSLQEKLYELGAGVRMVEEKRADENKQNRYGIQLQLPKLSGSDPAREERFNKAVHALIDKEIGEFKQMMAENAKDAAKERAAASNKESAKEDDAPKGSLEIGHSVTEANQDFVSVLITSMSYTGGAHPNTNTKSLNYDLKTGAPVELASLFIPNSNYLKVISDYCLVELRKLKIGDLEWIRKGAGPQADNFKSWNITPQGLMITFDAYQVASYAEGPQEVVVPYSILKPIIKPDGLLGKYVK